jgi:hypothetical protein
MPTATSTGLNVEAAIRHEDDHLIRGGTNSSMTAEAV